MGRRAGYLVCCVLVLAGCSSPRDQESRALRQGQGWAATAEAITSERVGRALPMQFVARSLDTGAEAVEQHARTVEHLTDLPQPERTDSAQTLRHLAGALRTSGSGIRSGGLDTADSAPLLDAYAALMARTRTTHR
jgi:hypothetical protein